MQYRQLHHVFRTSEQKGIWIFSYGNLAGAVLGGIFGHALEQWLPLLPGFACYGLGVALGVAVTFRFRGWPLYSQLYRWARYVLHHHFRPQAYDIESAALYRPQETGETRPLLLPRLSSLSPLPHPTRADPLARPSALAQGVAIMTLPASTTAAPRPPISEATGDPGSLGRLPLDVALQREEILGMSRSAVLAPGESRPAFAPLIPHVAEVLGYNLGMYDGPAARASVAQAAEEFFIGLRQPLRLLAWSTPATIEPALRQITQLMQACGPQEYWRVQGLDEQYGFLQDLAAEADLRRNHFYLCTWTSSPQPPQALWNTASSRFLCPVLPHPTLPAIFAGHWHAAFDHCRPYPDSPDQSYIGFYYLYDFQGDWTLESLHPLFQKPFPVAVMVDIDTWKPSTAARRTISIQNGLSIQLEQQARMGTADPGSEAAFEDVQSLKGLLQKGRRVHMLRMVLAIRARTRAELAQHADDVAGTLAGRCELAPAWGQQKGLLSFFTTAHRNAIPDAPPDWPWVSGGVGLLTGLFGLPSRNDTRGPLHGVDDYSGTMFFLDPFARPNAQAGYQAGNTLLAGQPGSGKTTFLLMLARRFALYGKQVVVLEPQGHSKRLAQLLGPEACAYHPLDFAHSQINVLDRTFANPASQITGTVNLLRLLISCALQAPNTDAPEARHFTSKETRALYQALARIYRPHLWEQPLPPERTPRLEELCNALSDLRTREGRALSDEIGGLFVDDEALGPLFNTPTNVDLTFQHRVVCFDVLDIDEHYRPWIYATLFQRLMRYIYTRDPAVSGELVCQIDEARHLLNEPVVARAVRDAAKRIRTRGAILQLADQDISTYTTTEYGKQILANCPFVFFGRLEGPNVEQLTPLFPRLNEWYQREIITATTGRFIVKCHDEYYQIRVEPSLVELRTFAGM